MAWFDDLLNSIGQGISAPQQTLQPSAQTPFAGILAQLAANREFANAQPVGPGGRPPTAPSAGRPYDARSEDAGQREGTLPGQTNAGTPGSANTGVMQGPPVPPDSVRANGPASGGAGAGGGGIAQMPGAGRATNPVAAGMARYPSTNPTFALQSAMLDAGMNPFRADPMMQYTMALAPGLAQAFMLNNLTTTAEGMKSAGGEGNMFGSFLGNALSGRMGSLTDPLSQASSQLPDAFRAISDMQNQMAANGTGIEGLNPFMQALMSVYGNAQGAAGAFGGLNTPFMSQGVGQAYQNQLNNAAGMAQRSRAADYGRDITPRNFWEYLFPSLSL